jgi:hypothetical protein
MMPPTLSLTELEVFLCHTLLILAHVNLNLMSLYIFMHIKLQVLQSLMLQTVLSYPQTLLLMVLPQKLMKSN